LAARRGQVVGHLRVVAPLGFGRRHVAPVAALGASRRAISPGAAPAISPTCTARSKVPSGTPPRVAIDLTLSDRLGGVPEGTFDLAVHVGEIAGAAPAPEAQRRHDPQVAHHLPAPGGQSLVELPERIEDRAAVAGPRRVAAGGDAAPARPRGAPRHASRRPGRAPPGAHSAMARKKRRSSVAIINPRLNAGGTPR
jgi:hypothetical protein